MKTNTKLTTAIILILLTAVVAIAAGKPDDPGPGNQSSDEFVASDVGGGGWMHSGTFHPLDSDVILIGSDVTGGIYRTDDSGESWRPWNEGLSNYDQMRSMYVEDLVGVVEPDGTVAFYAATHGGIYRASEDGPWDWAGDDQPRDDNGAVSPAESLIYWSWQSTHRYREPISFSCIDWNGENLIAAGAGRVRWSTSYETDHYPGISPDLLKDELECDPDGLDPDYPCNLQLQSVWIHDLDHPENGWQPLDAPDGFGTPRDISLTRIDGNDYLAVATHTGLYLYDFAEAQWHDLADNLFWSGDLARLPREVAYGSELTAWSIHLTSRGTLFAAMQRLDGTFPSGVYHIFNVPVLSGGSWIWVGDREPVFPHEESMWEIGLGDGFFGQPDLIYLTVVDGDGEDPDTLYLGDRRSNYGLFKGEQPLDFMNNQGPYPGHWTTSVTNTSWTTWYPYAFDKGWIEFWGPQVIFHPVVMPGSSPHKLVVQFNGMMHVSDDGGSTWDQRYCEEVDGAWTSRGYNEHSVRGATFLADGRPVFSNGDTGTFVSVDIEGSAYEYIHPEIKWDSVPTDDAIKATVASDIHMLPDWMPDPEDRDALFINYSYKPTFSKYGKLFMHLYDPNVGPSNDPNEWFHITKSLSDIGRYVFGDYVFIDDETCLLSYVHYSGIAGLPGSVPDGYGVFKGVFVGFDVNEEPVWTWEDWSNGLPVVENLTTFVTSMLHNDYNGERIFLAAARNHDEGGGLYVLEPTSSDTWQVIINSEVNDGTWSQYRDFRSLAQSTDGSYLYVGTRGLSSGIGGLLLCKDPSRATDMRKWEILANDPDNQIRPFEFYLNLPFWSEDFPYFGAPESIDKNLTYISSLAVDPRDRKIVYVGLYDEGMSLREGLWKFDGKNWEHLSLGQLFEGMANMVLEFNPYVPGQLLIGTDGQGLYIMESEDD